LDPPNQNNNNTNKRIVRKRIGENGDINTDNDVEIGRQYLENLWDSVEKKYEKELKPGRLRYLESMMSMLAMSMSFPTNAPTNAPTQSSKPPTPTKMPAPSTTTPGPAIAPSSSAPVEVPTTTTLPPSLPPLSPCETEKENFLLEVLSEITDKSIFLDVDTPQGMAYSFLLEETPSFVCTPTLMQRYGLSTFYFATGGANWTNNKGWLGPTQECDWYGVKCNESLFSTSLNLGT